MDDEGWTIVSYRKKKKVSNDYNFNRIIYNNENCESYENFGKHELKFPEPTHYKCKQSFT